MSIRLRWTLWFLILIALTLMAHGVILHERVKAELEKQLRSNLSVQAALLGSLVEQNLIRAGDLKDASQFALSSKIIDPNIRVRVAQPDGKIVFDSAGSPAAYGTLDLQSLSAMNGSESQGRTSDRYFDAYPIHGFSQAVGVIETSASRQVLRPTLSLLTHDLGGSIFAVSIAGVILALMITSALVKPIRELGDAADQISKGSWDRRVSFRRGDELGQLADKIHQMAESLQWQFRMIEAEKMTFQALLTSMIDGLIVLDENQCIQFLNPQAERTLRVKSEKVSGKSLDSVWPLRYVDEMVKESLRQSAVVSREITLPYNVLKIYVVPMARVTGASAMLIFRDITELRRLEDTRNQFLGQVSHELRTPLTIVKGFVVTLLDDPRLADTPEDIRKILLRIEEEADRLSKMVEELLELSRLKTGRSALTFAPLSLEDLVLDALESMKSHAERYGISMELEVEGAVPQILGDSRGLKRVLLNLLDNAIKYSPKESQVKVKVEGFSDRAVLTVIDQGSGISQEDLPRIFERFFQGKKREEGKGWGLGLPIVKEIVEAHEGKIRIDSIEGKGTTVVVILPAKGLQIEERKL